MSVKEQATILIDLYEKGDREAFMTFVRRECVQVINVCLSVIESLVKKRTINDGYGLHAMDFQDKAKLNAEQRNALSTFNTRFLNWKALHNRVITQRPEIAANPEFTFAVDLPLFALLIVTLKPHGYDDTAPTIGEALQNMRVDDDFLDTYLTAMWSFFQMARITKTRPGKNLEAMQELVNAKIREKDRIATIYRALFGGFEDLTQF